ncbi:MAG: hypothetical protein FWD24_03820 [Treponema sp.]|nr:hypothetical protein [Treponema sp.]
MEDHFNGFIDEQLYKAPKDLLGYAEEYIIVNDVKDNHLLKFTLSNKLDDIEIAILNRTGHDIDLKNAHWKINDNLSIYVKQLVNKYRVKYSMTTWNESKVRQIIVNMRSNNIWLITGFDELDGTFYCWNKIEILNAVNNFNQEINDLIDKINKGEIDFNDIKF